MKKDKHLLAEQMRFAAIAGLRPINDFGASYLLEDDADGGDGDVARNIEASMEAPITEKDTAGKYKLIIFDRYNAADSTIVNVQSSKPNLAEVLIDELLQMWEVPADREVEVRDDFAEKIKMGNNLAAMDYEEESYILIKA